ncbi:MAG TPA: hypothetical protein VGO36_03485 [Solirubrobacterales bacterium]|jgi:hypothetical protein|nr:hypothetical protein [Solirubrobacterales bacterium]
MQKWRPRLSYANVIATLALFIALGGGAYAASQLPKNSVGAKQLKKNSVTAAKIKKGAIEAAKISGILSGAQIDASTLGTVPKANEAAKAANAGHAETAASASKAGHADSATSAGTAATATDADALGGKPASAFAAANTVRTATIEADGTIIAARSDGITQANIFGPHTPGSGFYCIDGLDPAPTAAIATINFGSSPQGTVYTDVTPAGEPGCNVYVATYAAGLAADAPFTLLIH